MARRRKTKEEKQIIYQNGPFKDITTEESLVEYLKNNKNDYNDFMLVLIERKHNGLSSALTPEKGNIQELHHIIPTSEGGPNENWNLVPVSYEEHKLAHQKRYEVFGSKGDLVAALGRESLPEDFAQFRYERAKLGHATMKARGIGFYNPELQRELGKRSGGRKTIARETGYHNQVSQAKKNLFSKSLVFTHRELGIVGETKPGQFKRTGEIKDFLINLMPKGCPAREQIVNDKQFTTNINKILNPLIGKTTLARSSYKGWSVTEKT